MQQIINIAKALSDETRVRIVLCLRSREVCVCQLVELCGLAPSTTSKHMAILKHAGLVQSRKEGRWVHYRLAGDEAPKVVRGAIAWLTQSLPRDKTIAADARTLRCILNEDPEDLCRRQAARCC